MVQAAVVVAVQVVVVAVAASLLIAKFRKRT